MTLCRRPRFDGQGLATLATDTTNRQPPTNERRNQGSVGYRVPPRHHTVAVRAGNGNMEMQSYHRAGSWLVTREPSQPFSSVLTSKSLFFDLRGTSAIRSGSRHEGTVH
ncbi:hypothetical protein CISG_06204 [Coccidioides immitis RMSCC 3703]|uniref:Uncharacterized protein n=1 Tax=Coccidioides immitis RMSCC 3703 TaxID=454286 RepID=A0A0J8QVS8_COCIT|nr:hypothetical protein CISG_06204 [Coccidioides immitis RMSCC 3703]